MKRKDTKTYEMIAENYCSTRHSLDYYKKYISQCEENLLKAKETYDTLADKNNEEVKKWYNSYIEIVKANISMSEYNIIDKIENIEEKEKILTQDYGDNPNELYKQWIENNNK